MDWVRDGQRLLPDDLDRVFKYEPASTRVLRMLESDERPVLWSLKTDGDWNEWIKTSRPSPENCQRGLVLLLAKRVGTTSPEPVCPMNGVDPDLWLQQYEKGVPQQPEDVQAKAGGRRGLRTVPFNRSTFEKVSLAFNMHSSISRAISRADLPVFSHTNATMEGMDAFVYNCRTSNAWNMDLATTITYFPHCGLTYAVLFGCSNSTEKEIIRRLTLANDEVYHPLLLSGIIAEIERQRHIYHVDNLVDEVEALIFDLQVVPDDETGTDAKATEKAHKNKRKKWLDAAYNRNCLISWQAQLQNMVCEAEAFDVSLKLKEVSSDEGQTIRDHHESQMVYEETRLELRHPDSMDSSMTMTAFAEHQERLKAAGYKIKTRIRALIQEYDEKVRDCNMRLDGLAMATQWAQGEINLEIAKATSRDSKQMRSIAIVTMIFLPGTFFAGMFSMTFFNWSGDGSEPVISGYFWIYIVFTVVCTLLTLGLWYYFNTYRRSLHKFKEAKDNGV